MSNTICCNRHGWRPVELIYLDLEDERPGFIEDPTFNVIPDIEDFFDVDFDFLEEDEESEEVLSFWWKLN